MNAIIIERALRSKDMKKFKIPMVYQPSINKTIRFPIDVVDEIEKAIVCKNCTFTAFVIASVRFSLENLKDNEETV